MEFTSFETGPATVPPDVASAARDCIARGWSPIPVHHRSKKPVHNDWPNLHLTADDVETHFGNEPRNIGLSLGEASGWLIDIDLDCPESRRLAPSFLPPTGAVFGRKSRPRSHYLYVVKGPLPTHQFRDTDGTMLVELRSSGAQTIVPPSLHPDGELVTWDEDGDPTIVDGDELLRRVRKLAAATLIARHWPSKGCRHDMANALIGGLLRASLPEKDVEEFVLAVAGAAGDEEARHRPDGVRTTVRRLSENKEATGWPAVARYVGQPVVEKAAELLGIPLTRRAGEGRDGLTDLGNTERLISRYGSDLRYCKLWDTWLVWKETHWVPDITGQVMQMAKDTVLGIYQEAGTAATIEQRKELADHAKRSESLHRLRAMVELAKSETAVTASPSQFDSDAWRLNVLNGTIDLRTGQLHPHRREDFITKMAPVVYDEHAHAPTWQQFLEKVVPDSEIRAYLQRVVGYSLTGDISEHAMFLFHGTGSNGKSTFLNTLQAMLGDYAQQADFTTFLTKKHDGVRNDVAELVGARVVSASEVEDGRRLSEPLIKQLTGGDVVKARRLYQENFEFRPQFKLYLAANHVPQVRGMDHGFWRRLKRIPFTVTVSDSERDRSLPAKLEVELPGILAWAVKGCLEWQAVGLREPDAVRRATGEYREEMDTLGDFLGQCCIMSPEAKVSSANLYADYTQWCQQNGEHPLSQKRLGTKLKERGFTNRPSTGGRNAWFGLDLVSATEARSGSSGPCGPSFEKVPTEKSPKGTFSNTGVTSSTSSTDDDTAF